MKGLLRIVLPAALAALCFPPTAYAQTYPAKPVRVIVVFPPGGSNDVTARIVFQRMTEQTGQQFIVDNRGGAAGTIGAAVVANSPADGYVVMVQSTTHIANAHLYKKLPYDTLGDFIGVTTLARQVGMLVVHPALPVKSTKEFVALAKKRPGDIVYGSAGAGSYVHLAMALIESSTGTTMTHVPYKGGGPLNIALASGEVQATVGTIASLVPNLQAKRLRALGVTSEQRTTQFPDVPAIAEAVPGYEFTASKLSAQTLDPLPMTPEQFAARLKSDYVKYEKVVKLSGAKID